MSVSQKIIPIPCWDEEHAPLFKTLIEQSNDAIFIVSPETGQVLFCNNKACQNLGYENEELLNMQVFDYAQNVKNLEQWHALVDRLQTKDHELFETEQRHKDGTMLPVEVNVRLIAQTGNSYMVSIARNITARKNSEALLISELSHLESFMSALDDGIVVVDQNLKVLYQNDTHQKMAGDHKGVCCYKAFHGKEEPCEECHAEKALVDGNIHKRESTMLTATGNVHLEIIAYPVKDSAGDIYAVAEVARNITKRKEGEEIQRNTAQARKQFISTAAHELGTPLSAILGYAELLSKQDEFGTFDAKQREEFINIIYHKTLALTDIVDSLLDVSRIDAGKQLTVEKALCDLSPVIQTMVSNYNKLFPKHDLEAVLPGQGLETVWADEGKIGQLLENLLTNAVKYSPQGGQIHLQVEAAETLYRFTLSDEGIGMSDDQIRRIFEPFYRADADNPEVGGLGLGMSIVKQIIEGHQGSISVEHNVPRGLKVSFTLPRKVT